jgi:hypothetical protein
MFPGVSNLLTRAVTADEIVAAISPLARAKVDAAS